MVEWPRLANKGFQGMVKDARPEQTKRNAKENLTEERGKRTRMAVQPF